MSIVFSFSRELKWPQEKLKTMLMQNFGVTNKEHYGMLWYFLEWSIVFSLNVRQSLAWRPSLLHAAMTIVVILANSRSFSPPGSLLPISYPCLGCLGVRAPGGNLLQMFVHRCTLFSINGRPVVSLSIFTFSFSIEI